MSIGAYLEELEPLSERREGKRRVLRLRAEGSASDGTPLNAEVLNMSESGLMLETAATLAPGELLEVELPEAGSRSAEVVWAEHGRAGCRFTTPLGRAELNAAELRSEPQAGETETGGESFGQRLKRLRHDRGLSAQVLAQRVGVSKPTLWNWETDRTWPQPRLLAALADILQVPQTELRAGPVIDLPPVERRSNPGNRRTETLAYHKACIAELLGVEPDQVDVVLKI